MNLSCATPIIETQNVWKWYERGRIQVLRGVSICVAAGEVVALCGPSGGGKSTLLHLISGLDKPDRGAVYLDGRELRIPGTLLQALRHKIGFVFQLHNLIPDLTLWENCLIPAIAAGQERKLAQARFLELALVHQADLPHRCRRSHLRHRLH